MCRITSPELPTLPEAARTARLICLTPSPGPFRLDATAINETPTGWNAFSDDLRGDHAAKHARAFENGSK